VPIRRRWGSRVSRVPPPRCVLLVAGRCLGCCVGEDFGWGGRVRFCCCAGERGGSGADRKLGGEEVGARGEERERWIWFGVVYICLLRLFLTVES
jgi:hypothetical protein